MPFISTSREAIVTSPVSTASTASRISAAFSAAVLLAVEGDHRREAAGDRVGRDDLDGPVGVRGRVLGRQEHVRVVRQDHRLVGVERLHGREQVCRRRVHRLPALDDRERADVLREALEEPAVPVSRDDGDDAGRRALRRHVGDGREQPLLALARLLVHVRDLDAVDRADRAADRERRARIVGVHVHLDRGRVADDEQRVADLLELLLERLAIELVPLR